MKDFPSKCKTCANAIKTCRLSEEFESVVVFDCKVSECKYEPCEILISTNHPGKELYMKTMRELADDEGIVRSNRGRRRIMTTPFYNDMFSTVYRAFKNLYPDKDCICQWSQCIESEGGKEAYGVTSFLPDGRVMVELSADIKVFNAVEVFAHELAHVAVGDDKEEHGKEWLEAFDKISEEYSKVATEVIEEWEKNEYNNHG